MESFRISVKFNNISEEILVIPDECTDFSIFHLIKDGSEYCKLVYKDPHCWELVEGAAIDPGEVSLLGSKIDEYYSS